MIQLLTRPSQLRLNPLTHFNWNHESHRLQYNFVSDDSIVADRVQIVLGIVYCSTETELMKIQSEFENYVTRFPYVLYDRCFVFGMDFENSCSGKTFGGNVRLFPDERWIEQECTSTIQVHMEAEMNNLSAIIVETLTSMIDFFGKTSFDGHQVEDNYAGDIKHLKLLHGLTMDDRKNTDTKSKKIRWVKKNIVAADYCLLLYSPEDALLHFNAVMPIVRQYLNGSEWKARALRGIATAYAMRYNLNPCPNALVNVLKNGFHAVKTFAKLDMHDAEMCVLIKLAWMCATTTPYAKKRECLQVIDRTLEMAPDLSLQQRAILCHQFVLICGKLGFIRKSVLFVHEMALIHAQLQQWNTAHSLLATALQLVSSSYQSSKSSDSHWTLLRAIILEQMIVVAQQLGSTSLSALHSLELLKLTGSLPRPDNLALTEEDLNAYQVEKVPMLYLQKGFLYEIALSKIGQRKSINRSGTPIPPSILSLCTDHESNSTFKYSSDMDSPKTVDTSSNTSNKISAIAEQRKGFAAGLSTPKFSAMASAFGSKKYKENESEFGNSYLRRFSTSDSEDSLDTRTPTSNVATSLTRPSVVEASVSSLFEINNSYRIQKLVSAQHWLLQELAASTAMLPMNFLIELKDLPIVVSAIVCPPKQHHLVHMMSDQHSSCTPVNENATFVFSPFDKTSNQNFDKQEHWVQNEESFIRVSLSNPLDVPLQIQSMRINIDGIKIECYSKSFTLPAKAQNVSVILAAKPLQEGTATVTSIHMRIINLVVEKSIISYLRCNEISVLSSIPYLFVQSNFESESAINLIAGERRHIKILLENLGHVAVRCMRISLRVWHTLPSCVTNQALYDSFDTSNKLDTNDTDDVVVWDRREFAKACSQYSTLHPCSAIQLPLKIIAASSTCVKAEISVEYAATNTSKHYRRQVIPVNFQVHDTLQIQHSCIISNTTTLPSNQKLKSLYASHGISIDTIDIQTDFPSCFLLCLVENKSDVPYQLRCYVHGEEVKRSDNRPSVSDYTSGLPLRDSTLQIQGHSVKQIVLPLRRQLWPEFPCKGSDTSLESFIALAASKYIHSVVVLQWQSALGNVGKLNLYSCQWTYQECCRLFMPFVSFDLAEVGASITECPSPARNKSIPSPVRGHVQKLEQNSFEIDPNSFECIPFQYYTIAILLDISHHFHFQLDIFMYQNNSKFSHLQDHLNGKVVKHGEYQKQFTESNQLSLPHQLSHQVQVCFLQPGMYTLAVCCTYLAEKKSIWSSQPLTIQVT